MTHRPSLVVCGVLCLLAGTGCEFLGLGGDNTSDPANTAANALGNSGVAPVVVSRPTGPSAVTFAWEPTPQAELVTEYAKVSDLKLLAMGLNDSEAPKQVAALLRIREVCLKSPPDQAVLQAGLGVTLQKALESGLQEQNLDRVIAATLALGATQNAFARGLINQQVATKAGLPPTLYAAAARALGYNAKDTAPDLLNLYRASDDPTLRYTVLEALAPVAGQRPEVRVVFESAALSQDPAVWTVARQGLGRPLWKRAGAVTALKRMSDGRVLTAGGGEVVILDAQGNDAARYQHPMSGMMGGAEPFFAAVSGDGQALVTAWGTVLAMWNLAAAPTTPTSTINAPAPITSLAFDAKNAVIVGLQSGVVARFLLGGNQPQIVSSPKPHNQAVRALIALPLVGSEAAANVISAAGEANFALNFQTEGDPKPAVQPLAGPMAAHAVGALALSVDGLNFLTAGSDGAIHEFVAQNATALREYRAPSPAALSALATGGDLVVAAAGNVALCFSSKNGAFLGPIGGDAAAPVTAVEVAADGKHVYLGRADGTISLLSVPSAPATSPFGAPGS